MHNNLSTLCSCDREKKPLSHMVGSLTRFRRTSDGDLVPGPEQGFDIVGGYFSADLKSFLCHSINMHFPITRSSKAFLRIKVMLLS
jgi:hypothetical protein